jgi:group I intron endonuclease
MGLQPVQLYKDMDLLFPSYSGIYKIQSQLKPELFYIGSSVNIQKRWQQHKQRLKAHRHENQKLQNHADKYGISDLKFTVLFSCDFSQLAFFEQAQLNMSKPWFNILQTCKPGSYKKRLPGTVANISKSWKQRPPISMFSRLFKSKA